MSLAGDILKRLFVWVFPVILFDGCLNRDPYLKIDERYSIAAISGGSPKGLINRDPNGKQSWDAIQRLSGTEFLKASEQFRKTSRWDLENVTDYKLSDAAIIGNSAEGFFIADRHTGVLKLFPSSKDRDQVLRDEYGVAPTIAFSPPSELMWIKSRLLWPWIYLYYAGCFAFIPWLTITQSRRPPGILRAAAH